jgi:hypothetical protein
VASRKQASTELSRGNAPIKKQRLKFFSPLDRGVEKLQSLFVTVVLPETPFLYPASVKLTAEYRVDFEAAASYPGEKPSSSTFLARFPIAGW